MIKHIIATLILTAALYTAYTFGLNAENEPMSDFVWINNNRIHLDSTIDCKPIYNEDMEIIGSWIRVVYNNNAILIECVDTDDYNWQEFKQSWIMAFQKANNEYKGAE
jgi:hypothetical protein